MLFKKSENIIIVGAGRLGSCLAGALSQKGFRVIVIDKDEDAFRKLPESFSGYKITGDGTDIDILKSADIENSQMVISCTDSDNVNSLIAQIASRIYGIQQVYTRLNDTDKDKLLDGFNIHTIYPFKLSMNEFERLSSIKLEEVMA
ncbi:MAG: TrkA family potassium uptake protein [Oscillospiraceae bacterium]|jgi:trk system potassium uptake protein TrkA